MITLRINSSDHGYTPGKIVIANRPAILEWLHELKTLLFSKKQISVTKECEYNHEKIEKPQCDPKKNHFEFSAFAELYAGVYELK